MEPGDIEMSKKSKTGVAGVMESTAPIHVADPGSNPRATLQAIVVKPISHSVAKALVVRHHYLHSLPGGTLLVFGVFVGIRLMGVLTIGCGPSQAYRLVEDACTDDCAVLTRLWIADDLPKNSESRVIGVVLRSLKRNTNLKFLVSYADPSQGHVGTIYQATGWVYTGLSDATPLYDIGDGVPRHSRSLSHALGTHSVKFLKSRNVDVRILPQAAKHRYIRFLDPTYRTRLRVVELPYPKNGVTS